MFVSPLTASPSSTALGLLNLNGNQSSSAVNSRLKSAATTSGTTSSSTSSTASMDSTFLSLLVDELQNQDPSSPMDSTQMVGQMISLNQLDQLISINTQLGGSASTGVTGYAAAAGGEKAQATAASAAAPSADPGSAKTMAAKTELLSSTLSNPAAAMAANPLPNTSTLQTAAQSNAAAVGATGALDLSNLNANSNFGGK